MTDTRCVIWSFEHGAWWRANHVGYTETLAEAGIYDAIEAQRIVEKANLVRTNEVALPLRAFGASLPMKRLTEMDDDEFVTAIFERYRGRFTELDFSGDAVRSQLALDLGMLIGLTCRLLSERNAKRQS